MERWETKKEDHSIKRLCPLKHANLPKNNDEANFMKNHVSGECFGNICMWWLGNDCAMVLLAQALLKRPPAVSK